MGAPSEGFKCFCELQHKKKDKLIQRQKQASDPFIFKPYIFLISCMF
jgi:hypothetical protein